MFVLLPLLLSLSHLFPTLDPSVVTLRNAERPICSAVVVDAPDGQLLTGKHCYADEDPQTINVGGYPVKVVREGGLDLLLLSFTGAKPPLGRPLLLRQHPLQRGDVLYIVGHPYGDPLTIFKGTVASVTVSDGTFWIDGRAARGMSGGPIVDADGRLVSLVLASVDGALVAEPLEVVRDFVAGKTFDTQAFGK